MIFVMPLLLRKLLKMPLDPLNMLYLVSMIQEKCLTFLETYEDEQCTKLDRTYVYRANNVCLLGPRSLSFAITGNGVSFSRDCKSSPPSSPGTISFAIL